MGIIRLFKGLKAHYKPNTLHKYAIYFCTDTKEILVDNESYGFYAEGQQLLNDVTYFDYTLTLHFTNGYTKVINLDRPIIIDSLDSTRTDASLSANQGKVLNDSITSLTEYTNAQLESVKQSIKDVESTLTQKIEEVTKQLTDKITSLGQVYNAKGSVQDLSALLAISNVKAGDVYNVISSVVLNDKYYDEGTNFVYIGEEPNQASSEINWDSLGGIMHYVGRVDESNDTGEIFNLYGEDSIKNKATGNYSHAEGYNTQAIGENSHSEGKDTVAQGDCSHAEGNRNNVIGNYSHAEGTDNQLYGTSSHAEGWANVGIGANVHTEGAHALAQGQQSHAEGYFTTSIGLNTHAEGQGIAYEDKTEFNILTVESNVITTEYEFAIGDTLLFDNNVYYVVTDVKAGTPSTVTLHTQFNEGTGTLSAYIRKGIAYGDNSHTEGYKGIAMGNSSHAEGSSTQALGNNSHSEGLQTISSGIQAHSEGQTTQATGPNSHAEGQSTIAQGNNSHAEGLNTKAEGVNSHTEGTDSVASGQVTHAEGAETKAIGDYSHAQGYKTTANGTASTASGSNTNATGNYSMSGGVNSNSVGSSSLAYGNHINTSNDGETGVGKFNVSVGEGYSNALTQFTVGVGTNEESRANAFTITQNGDVYIKSLGNYDGVTTNGNHLVQVINDVDNKIDSNTTIINQSINTINDNINQLQQNITDVDTKVDNATIYYVLYSDLQVSTYEDSKFVELRNAINANRPIYIDYQTNYTKEPCSASIRDANGEQIVKIVEKRQLWTGNDKELRETTYTLNSGASANDGEPANVSREYHTFTLKASGNGDTVLADNGQYISANNIYFSDYVLSSSENPTVEQLINIVDAIEAGKVVAYPVYEDDYQILKTKINRNSNDTYVNTSVVITYSYTGMSTNDSLFKSPQLDVHLGNKVFLIASDTVVGVPSGSSLTEDYSIGPFSPSCFVSVTQEQYDSIQEKSSSTIYFITE